MDLLLSDDQASIVSSVAEVLDDLMPLENVRKVLSGEAAVLDALRRVEYVLICANTDTSKHKPPDPPDPMRRPGVGPRKTVAPLSQEGAELLFALINGSSPDGG